jgi:hypothetical protein
MSRGRVTGSFEETLVLPIEPFHEELVDESRKEAYVKIKVDFGFIKSSCVRIFYIFLRGYNHYI